MIWCPYVFQLFMLILSHAYLSLLFFADSFFLTTHLLFQFVTNHSHTLWCLCFLLFHAFLLFLFMGRLKFQVSLRPTPPNAHKYVWIVDVCFGRYLSFIILGFPLPFFTSVWLRTSQRILGDLSQHSVLLPLSALTKATKPFLNQGISEHSVSPVFNCGCGTHSIDSTHP